MPTHLRIATTLALLVLTARVVAAASDPHARVAQRRAGVAVICHRGASEFAHENTLDAYRATFELGGDGNEIDIRATRDGVLVCFHDDMLDMLLAGAYGDVSEHTWAQLQSFSFRDPGPMAAACRIPTFDEALALHRERAGLLILDVKQHGLDTAIADALTRADVWDNVIGINVKNAPELANDVRFNGRRLKAGLFQDRSDVFADKVAAALKLPGDDLIVDDPRAAIVALGRTLGKPSPPSSVAHDSKPKLISTADLLKALQDQGDWDDIAEGDDEQAASAQRIIARARAADQLLLSGHATPEVFVALAERARRRSLHRQWVYHGLDGATSLRALILLGAPDAAKVAREIIWGNDAALVAVRDPKWPNPPSWADWRIKQVPFQALPKWKGDAAVVKQLCRDYLALSDAEAREIGIPLFESAAKALLEVARDESTAKELLGHRLQEVRGRALLVCLNHADEPWAIKALQAGAPHALAYVVKRD